MAWVKVEYHTPEKPELHQAAAKLNRDIRVVFYHWFKLLVWADANVSEDGIAHGMTLSALSKVAGLDGLAECLCEVGWLTQRDQGVALSNWGRHNGSSAKSRALAQRRQAKKRHASVTQKSRAQRDASYLISSGSDSDSPIQEKTKRTTVFENLNWTQEQRGNCALKQAWQDFVEHRRAKRAALTPKAADLVVRKLVVLSPERAVSALEAAIANGWTGVFPEPESRSGSRSQSDRARRDAATDWSTE